MYQYPKEWNNYKSSKEYQSLIATILRGIFQPDMVYVEWDSSTYSLHPRASQTLYAPRTDIAVGPFNSGMELDIGVDTTTVMKAHPLVKKVAERNGIGWNDFSRCFLAIEIVFSGASKYILGDLANASYTGSIGFIITREGKLHSKALRMSHYYQSQSDSEAAPMRNIMIFTDKDFLQFLWELQHPEQVWRALLDEKYKITFGGFWGGTSFPVKTWTDRVGVDEDDSDSRSMKKFSILNIPAKKIVEILEVGLIARRYIVPTNVAWIYKLTTKQGGTQKVMLVMDMGARPELRGKGIDDQIIDIFTEIAKKNGCSCIATELAEIPRAEPLEAQIEMLKNHGFEVWHDGRAEFSGWLAKKTLQGSQAALNATPASSVPNYG